MEQSSWTLHAAADAGFVVYSRVRPTVTRIDGLTTRNQEPRISIRRDNNENIFTLADRGRTFVIDRKPAKFPILKSAVLLTFGRGDVYLSIRWAPDKDCVEACCGHIYSLYRIGETAAELVLENLYDCDV